MAGKAGTLGTVRRLLCEISLSPWHISGLIACAVLGVAASAAAPLLIGRAIDALVASALASSLPPGGTPGEALAGLREQGRNGEADVLAALDFTPGIGLDGPVFVTLLLAALASFVAAALLSWGQGAILNSAVHRGVRALRQEVDNAILRAPVARLEGHKRGDILSRVTNDIDNVANALSQALGQILSTLLSIVVLFGIMFWLSPLLAFSTILLLPLAGYLTTTIIKRNRSRFLTQMQTTGSVTAQVDEMISGHDILVSLSGMDEAKRRFRECNETLRDASWKAQFVAGLAGPLTTLVANLSFVVICLLGVLRVSSGTMTIGEIQIFVQYNRQLAGPVSQLASIVSMMQAGLVSADRIFEVLDWPSEEVAGQNLGDGTALEFDDLHFSYEADRPVLEGVSLVAPQGSALAVVGRTGAGKSTLIDLVCRFRLADRGQIRLGGTPLTDWNLRALRERIGVVAQDAWIFHGTIRDNIAYGAPSGSTDRVEAAAEAAHVTAFARALPDGLDTVLDGGGSPLSHGERQLVCIARVFAKDPTLIILDEATTSVDTRTEMLVQQALQTLAVDRTVVVISHRLTSIHTSDQVAVLEGGRIAERGTPNELAACGGPFSRLVSDQMTLLAPTRAPRTKEEILDDA